MDAALLQRIDLLRLTLNLGGNARTVREMLGLFEQTSIELVTQLDTACETRDLPRWLDAAHKLKGAALNVVAKRLQTLCLEAEAIDTLPHPQAEAVLYHLHKELALLRDAVARYYTEAR